MIKDRDFRDDASEGGSENCADMFEIKIVDLSRDGRDEIILRGHANNLCSATGNCRFYIVAKQGKNSRKLLSASDYADVAAMGDQLGKTETKGYIDILLKAHLSAGEWEFISSREFYKR